MQRKATNNTRGPNAQEVAFQGWIKHRPCGYCGHRGPSIVDHARGATFKHNKTLIGHAFCTPKCPRCDAHKTDGNHKRHYEMTGKTESEVWMTETIDWNEQNGELFPDEVHDAMQDFSEHEQRMYAD